jgi:hypothetical protein
MKYTPLCARHELLKAHKDSYRTQALGHSVLTFTLYMHTNKAVLQLGACSLRSFGAVTRRGLDEWAKADHQATQSAQSFKIAPLLGV